MIKIEIAGNTDIGLVRHKNEDTFVIDTEEQFCLVADGMGGAAAGELASRFFGEATAEVFTGMVNRSEEIIVQKVQAAFKEANEKILRHIEEKPEHKGMGCTAELLALADDGFVIGHMGDSRTYRVRHRRMRQLTKDHSLVQEQVDQGIISREEAKVHTMRNIILRAVGVKEDLALDILRGQVEDGDLFLLCSDGLSDMVDEIQLETILVEDISLERKANKLIDAAKKAGGKDNITAVLLKIG
ncbi:MAG: Stp1/IreP family PP2C-type Ser/Thr phosphatase [Desulfobacteraceae bacterium]|nr:Stp1/IreP family PP2C-type Ser/Thr phosphatase [Desulfobacteraceae bacterium]